LDKDRKFIWTGNFIILLLSNGLFFLSLEMLTPTLPLFANAIGFTPSQIGLIIGMFTISAVIIRPFTGSLMKLIDKKYILLIGGLICALATFCYIFSATMIILLLLRLLHGLGFGAATTYYATLTSEELPLDYLGEGMGYFGAAESVCLSVGPLIGVAMLNAFDFSVLFTIGALVFFLATMMILGIKRPPIKKALSTEKEKNKIKFKFIEKRVLPQAFLTLLVGIILGSVLTFIPLFAEKQGISNVAWFFFISTIMGIATRIIAGKTFDRKGPIHMLIPAGFCLIIAMVLFFYVQTSLLLNIAGVFYGTGIGLAFPTLEAWVISLVDIGSREDAMSSFLNFLDIGIGGGSFLLGFIIEATSYQTMYLLLIIVVIAYLLLTVYTIKHYKIKTKKWAA